MPSDTPTPNSPEVRSRIQRRRRYPLYEKMAALAEAAQPSISYVARRHG